MRISTIVCEWTCQDIRYSLRSLNIIRHHAIFLVAVGPWVEKGETNIRVSAQPIERADIPKWLALSVESRTLAGESLLGNRDPSPQPSVRQVLSAVMASSLEYVGCGAEILQCGVALV